MIQSMDKILVGLILKKRGYHKSTIEKFGLGFAFPDGYDLINTAKAKAYNIDLLKLIGLVNINERDFFTNRVMFPIYGLSGRVLGFGGRALSTNEKTPKYLNSIESEIYNKSKILYGFFQGKNAIRKQENCFLVEVYRCYLSSSSWNRNSCGIFRHLTYTGTGSAYQEVYG